MEASRISSKIWLLLSVLLVFTVICKVMSRCLLIPTLGVDQLILTTSNNAIMIKNDNFENCNGCKLYDLTAPLRENTSDIDCVPLVSFPNTTICIYSPEEDMYVSGYIAKYGVWEGTMVKHYLDFLSISGPHMGVIDIGSNIGVYSIVAARSGHKVVAIEPNIDNIIRIHKSATFDEKVKLNTKLLYNAVGNIRVNVTLKSNFNDNNIGGTHVTMVQDEITFGSATVIFLDDLLPYCEFKDAIIKIDIEGYEHRAFAQSADLFDKIRIHAILMEWVHMKYVNGSDKTNENYLLLAQMLDFLTKRDFKPYSWENKELNVKEWPQWPDDMIWIANGTSFF